MDDRKHVQSIKSYALPLIVEIPHDFLSRKKEKKPEKHIHLENS